MFYLLNYIQFFLQKPWRNYLRSPSEKLFDFFKTFWVIPLIVDFLLYILLTPLRFINAVYYNVWVHGLWTFNDHFNEIFKPKLKGIRYKKGKEYRKAWREGFSERLKTHTVLGLIQFGEGLLFIIIDTFIPALTMYHGTDKNASISISKPGKWLVGSGNYAGSGIYFAIDKEVAKHYSYGDEPVIICARVSLGRIKNLNLTPSEIQSCVEYKGKKITDWGLEKKYHTMEWWRADNQWWEYCLLRHQNTAAQRSWKIRVLYLQNMKTKRMERVWGGKSLWLSKD